MFSRFVYASEGVQTPRIAYVGQALRNDLYQKVLIVSDAHICPGVAGKLRFAAALSGQETERYHLALFIVESVTGIIIAETVFSEPEIDVTAFLGTGFMKIFHPVAENIDLRLVPILKTSLVIRRRLSGQRKREPRFFNNFVRYAEKRKNSSYTEIGYGLIHDLLDLDRVYGLI